MNNRDRFINKKDRIRAAASKAGSLLEKCVICPRKCGANRLDGKRGYCRAGLNPRVYSFSPHRGEEPVLSGVKGSGTIFFSYCSMKCAYCQNYNFSQLDKGEDVTIGRLSEMMLYLQRVGCHNINLVSPTHYVPQIVLALSKAFDGGLTIPVVYNTSGYELVETLRYLEGIVDIYLPDMRYTDNVSAKRYSDAVQYADHNRIAVREMHRQVGDLVIDKHGIAQRGLIIRLLVLPHELSGTKESLRYIAENISERAFLSIMSQYYPTYKADKFSELSAGISTTEYNDVIEEAKGLNLTNGWVQDGPIELDPLFFGPNIKPQRPVGE
ncbi:MAG: radical SAM protein [Candidatus Omnitrophota bacterium]